MDTSAIDAKIQDFTNQVKIAQDDLDNDLTVLAMKAMQTKGTLVQGLQAQLDDLIEKKAQMLALDQQLINLKASV